MGDLGHAFDTACDPNSTSDWALNPGSDPSVAYVAEICSDPHEESQQASEIPSQSQAMQHLEALRTQQLQYHAWLVEWLQSSAAACRQLSPHGTSSQEHAAATTSSSPEETSLLLSALYSSNAARNYLHYVKVMRFFIQYEVYAFYPYSFLVLHWYAQLYPNP